MLLPLSDPVGLNRGPNDASALSCPVFMQQRPPQGPNQTAAKTPEAKSAELCRGESQKAKKIRFYILKLFILSQFLRLITGQFVLSELQSQTSVFLRDKSF